MRSHIVSTILIVLTFIAGTLAYNFIEYAEVDAVYMLDYNARGGVDASRDRSFFKEERRRTQGLKAVGTFLCFQMPTLALVLIRKSKYSKYIVFLFLLFLLYGAQQEAAYSKGDIHLCEFCDTWAPTYFYFGLLVIIIAVAIYIIKRIFSYLKLGKRVNEERKNS